MCVVAQTDGFDPDSTSDVLFEDSYVSNGDDAVAIKAGWDCAGYASADAAPSDNIFIRNVTQHIGGGGISIGSEMSGGVSNVVVEDVRLLHGSCECRNGRLGPLPVAATLTRPFLRTDGIQIKTGITRGGFVKNVSLNRLEIVGTTKEAIRIDGFCELQGSISVVNFARSSAETISPDRWDGQHMVPGPEQARALRRG